MHYSETSTDDNTNATNADISSQAMRQEENGNGWGTAQVAEALRQLQLDIPPEELLKEIRAQKAAALDAHREQARARAEAQAAADARQQTLKKWGRIVVPIGLLLLLFGPIWHNAARPSPDTQDFSSLAVLTEAAPGPPAGMMPPSPTSGDSYIPLASIPDERVFGCSFYTVDRIMAGIPQQQIILYPEEAAATSRVTNGYNGLTTGPYLVSSWSAVKHGGRVYLRGWIGDKAEWEQVQKHAVHIFNSTEIPEISQHPVQITFPADAVRYDGMYMRIDNPLYCPGYITKSRHAFYQNLPQEIVVSSVHLDQHAWEKW